MFNDFFNSDTKRKVKNEHRKAEKKAGSQDSSWHEVCDWVEPDTDGSSLIASLIQRCLVTKSKLANR